MILTSELLSQFPWLEHGFGTRLARIDQDTMASLQQIHSSLSMTVMEPGCAGEADSLVTSTPGLAVSVRTADCYPILIADKATRAVAAVHAGWRGTAAAIAKRTVSRMEEEFGTRPENIYAVLGPGIGACCYEVGEDVAAHFGRKRAGHLDLAALNRRQLLEAGVPGEQIDAVGSCTFCEAEKFYSYRREKEEAGRMVSFIRQRN
jgi:YfiH family protein